MSTTLTKKSSYRARPIKQNRRTKAEIDKIKTASYKLLEAEQPMTVRQLYYRLVSAGIIQKTEQEYDAVCRLLALMRRSGELPFSWLADATRWQRKPSTHSSLASMLERSSQFYRRSVWDNQDVYVEIWLKKDALAGVLWDVTREWDVPLMVTRGYPSLSYLYSAAEAMQEEKKPCYLYYFGDRDPSGVDIPRKVESNLREFAPDVELHFERVAVTEEQIITFGLHTRPTKKTDTRSKNFTGESAVRGTNRKRQSPMSAAARGQCRVRQTATWFCDPMRCPALWSWKPRFGHGRRSSRFA